MHLDFFLNSETFPDDRLCNNEKHRNHWSKRPAVRKGQTKRGTDGQTDRYSAHYNKTANLPNYDWK